MSDERRLSPYKGLTPFEDSELDVRFFFGREQERELIEANLMASRLTVLYGETGVGKSSVLRAGVAHHLRGVAERNLTTRGEPGMAVVVFDAWRDDPLHALRTAVMDAVTQALGASLRPPDDDVPLVEALRMWGSVLDGDIYVVLDQAEEYFLYHPAEDDPKSFAVQFPAVVNAPDLRANFLLAIREDALAKLDVFKARIPNVLGNYLRLEHLDPRAARAAIVEPIRAYNGLVGDDRDRRGRARTRQRGARAGRSREGRPADSPAAEPSPPARRQSASRRRTCSSSCTGSGRRSGAKARASSDSRRSAGSAMPSRSCAIMSTRR